MEIRDLDYRTVTYCPLLRTRPAEIAGLSHLPGRQKDLMLPVFVLGKWHKSPDPSYAYEKAAEAFGNRPHIIDITRIDGHKTPEFEYLLSPDNNYENWRKFIADHGKGLAIPTVQFASDGTLRDIVQQALILEKEFGRLALHVDLTERNHLHTALSVIAALNAPDTTCICILDGKHLTRDMFDPLHNLFVHAINEIRSVDQGIECVITSSSFPKSVTTVGSAHHGVIPILEREMYDSIGGRDIIIYGDHSSIHPYVYDEYVRGYIPRVDYPTDTQWIYYRHNASSKEKGYRAAAQAVINDAAWEDLGIWGTEKIKEMAQGKAEKMCTPWKWISVRVNIHLYRQANLCAEEAEELAGSDDYTDYDDADVDF